jgi:hypothetical protein
MASERLALRLARFYDDVHAELQRAMDKHAEFPSAHHGLSVIHEEFVELQELVYRQREERTAEEMRREAVQIAAMAARFALEICDPEIPG